MDKLTIKEIQLYRTLHYLRKNARSGEVKIEWHEHDFTGADISEKVLFDGQDIGLQKMKILLASVGLDKPL